MKKRLLSLLLIGCMLLPLLPVLPMQAGAAAPTLGQIGSSTTLYDDIVLGETALPMTYQDFLAASVEVETPQTAYKKYLMETPSVTWKGDWSLGAMIDGEYEPIEYIVFMQGKTLESNSLASHVWMTNASGYSSMIDAYLAGASDCGIWSTAASGNIGHASDTNIILRMPPSGNVAASGVGAYCYTVPSAGYISLSASLTNPDSHDTAFAFNTPTAMYLAVAVNGTVIFPTGATFDNRASWGNYATMSDLKAALESIDRFQVKAGDQVQICIAEKAEGNNPKLGLDPIVYTYESAEAASGTANQFTAKSKAERYTRNETAPTPYKTWVESYVSPSEPDTSYEAYRAYLLESGKITWSGNWSMGAIVDGSYEKMAYIIPMTNQTIDATAWSETSWMTTASGYQGILDKYFGADKPYCNIWGSTGAVLNYHPTQSVNLRMPGNGDASGIGAYVYTVPASGYISLSVSETCYDTKKDTSFAYATPTSMRFLVRVNDTVIFPAGASLSDRSSWANYSTIAEVKAALEGIGRKQVEQGAQVQICICENGTGDPKIGLDPIVSTYESETAASATATEGFALAKDDATAGERRYTRSTLPAVYSAWAAAQGSTDGETASAPDTEEMREAYRKYLLKNGKLTQSGNWQIGGYTGENGAFEPIAYRIPFTGNANILTATSWSNTTWYTTRCGYEKMIDQYVGGTFGGIWLQAGIALYRKSDKTLCSSLDNSATFVYRWTVPASGQITPTFADGTVLANTARFYIAYDGVIIWPEGAKKDDQSTWATGFSTITALNEALNGLHFDVEAGKALDFCGTCLSSAGIALNPTVAYTNVAKSVAYLDDVTRVKGSTPLTYDAYCKANSLTAGADAKEAYKTYLLGTGKVTWGGSWSMGAMLADGSYEKIDCIIPMTDKNLTATSFTNTVWTTNKSTYEIIVKNFVDNNANISPWTDGYVLHATDNTLNYFRLAGKETGATDGTFAYAYEIPATGGGLVGLQIDEDAATMTGLANMYLAVAINGKTVWPQKDLDLTKATGWASYTSVADLNAALATVLPYAQAGDLVQLCIREKGDGNVALKLNPIITFYSSADAVKELEGSLELGASFALNLHAVYENETVLQNTVLTLNGQPVSPVATRNVDYSYNVIVTKSGIAAKEMSDTVEYAFTNKFDGHVYQSGSLSLAGLLGQYLVYNGGEIDTTNKQSALVVATLNYGAAAQNYFGYNTENLANAALPAALQVTASSIKDGSFNAAAAIEATEGATLHWNSATLLLDDVLRLKLLIDADAATDPASLTLKLFNESGVAVETEWPLVSRGEDESGKYFKILIDVPMVNYRAGLKLGVYQNGTLVSDVLTYSVGAYACRVYDKSETPDSEGVKLNTMVDTVLALGQAAASYRPVTAYDYTQVADVRKMESNLAVNPSLMQSVDSRAILVNILKQSPSHALLRLNKDLYVVNESGEPLATLEEALRCLDHQVIPVFSPAADAYDALKAHFEANKYGDVMLLSNNVEKIAALKAVQPKLYVIWDARTATADTLPAMRASAATAGAYICLLPAELATMENTTYCTLRHLIPWYEAASSSDTESVRLLTAGACGILTENRAAVEACICNDEWFAEGSLTRYVPIIGHQGSTFSNETQPNTIHGFDWAMSKGAKTVEFDVHLTKDEKLVLMHDTTIQGTTNGTGTIANMTLAEIQQYKVDVHTGAPAQPIPTFLDVLEWAKDKDIVLTIEIKAYSEKLVELVAEQIAQYELWDKCRVACGSDEMIKKMRELCPTVHAAFVSSTSLLSYDTIVSRALNANAAYFAKYDFYDYDLLEDLAHRGISTNLWTPDSDVGIYGSYAKNPWSLCLNYVNKMSDIPCSLYSMYDSYSLEAGGSTDVVLLADTYTTEASVDVSAAEMVIIEGNETLTYANGTLSATAAGKATVMFRMPVTLGSTDITVYIYSAPVTVQVD
ncbi:MAG: hypothetical protein J6D31_06140 [Clostridia bacterium]|nr:hypothetical protein [Clostridia bacterium]